MILLIGSKWISLLGLFILSFSYFLILTIVASHHAVCSSPQKETGDDLLLLQEGGDLLILKEGGEGDLLLLEGGEGGLLLLLEEGGEGDLLLHKEGEE